MAEIEVEEVTEKKKGSKLKIIVPALVMVAGLGAAGYFFVYAPKAEAAAAEAASTTTELELGKIVRLAPQTLNLSDGRVLKIGLGLQLVAEPEDEKLAELFGAKAAAGGKEEGGKEATATTTMGGTESKALDTTITVMGSRTFEELSDPAGRQAAKTELIEKIKEAYHGDVHDVYLTDFVMS